MQIDHNSAPSGKTAVAYAKRSAQEVIEMVERSRALIETSKQLVSRVPAFAVLRRVP